MKTKVLFLLLTFTLLSCSVDKVQSVCSCEKVYYKYDVIGFYGGNAQWGYVEEYREPTDKTCDDAGDYIPLSSGHFYRIECN